MLWAAGIGVTPFASILKSIRHQLKTGGCKLQVVQFYWINREQTEFEWFIDLLVELAQTCPQLQIKLFFTGRISAQQGTRTLFPFLVHFRILACVPHLAPWSSPFPAHFLCLGCSDQVFSDCCHERRS